MTDALDALRLDVRPSSHELFERRIVGMIIWARRILAPVLLLIVLAGWGLSSPIGSSPDDDFHLPSIWCGLGDRPGLCESDSDPLAREVPRPIIAASCYAFHPTRDAGCFNPDRHDLAATRRVDIARGYPPVFYAVLSVMASPDVPGSVMAMRIFNSVLAVGIFTALFWCLPRSKRPALVISVAASVVPLGLFIIPSTNPSSWALISAATVWVAAWGALETRGRRQWALSGLMVGGALIGAGARADAAGFALFSIVIALVLGLRRSSIQAVPLIAMGVSAVLAVVFYVTAGQSGAATSGLANTDPPLSVRQILENALGIPSLWAGALGGWPLGWIDTPMPTIVPAAAVVVAAAAVFIGVRSLTVRRALALGAAAAAAYLFPLVLLIQSHATIGNAVQPRYILPLLVIGLGVASAGRGGGAAWRGPRQVIASVALVVAIGAALYVNIRRYTTGLGTLALDPGAGARWWWEGAPAPLVVEIATVVAAAGLLLILIRINRPASAQAEVGPPASVSS